MVSEAIFLGSEAILLGSGSDYSLPTTLLRVALYRTNQPEDTYLRYEKDELNFFSHFPKRLH